ncbi:hypothetical protein AQUCO_00200875v1 [Aquilegia coerulea]|uniref:FCP1 homology domain-containing protein n=1 Tax=Aquilegia coerulea TaxID=218851 RepID=A0A2G5F553_AQUCA|nr:hypothetical protein AQUCO_00200875v1 [Aquilegia coerulea]PIA63146.1 hypothetical protein AQUCO_00200875v1 [Aquilegia coerulea]
MEGVEEDLTEGRKQKEVQVYRSKRKKEPEVSLNKRSGSSIETSLENKNQPLVSSFAKPVLGKLDFVLALKCPNLSEEKTVKRSKKLPQSLENNNVDQNMVEARTKKTGEHKKECAVQPKRKRTKNVDENMVEARTKKADEPKEVCTVQPKGKRTKRTKKLDSSDGSILITSVNTGSVSECNNKVNGNTLFDNPKEEVFVNETLEATSEKTGEHKEVCAGQLKGKRTARRKKSPNTSVNNNQVEKKWDSSDRIIPISSVETGTVSESNNKVGGNSLFKTKSQEVPVNKTFGSTSYKTEEHKQVGAVQLKGKRTKRGKKSQEASVHILDQIVKGDNSDGKIPTTLLNAGTVSEFNVKMDVNTLCEIQNQEVPVDRTLEAASKIINGHDEVCIVQQKRKRKRKLKSPTDQGSTHPLESEKNKLSITLDQNVVGKSDSFDGNISTTLPKTASNKLEGETSLETQNQGVPVNKTSEATLDMMEELEGAGAVQLKGKRTKRGKKSQETSVHISDQNIVEKKGNSSDGKIPTTSPNTAIVSEFNDKMDVNTLCEIQKQEVPTDRTLEAASKTINDQNEVCTVQQKGKRRRGVKSRTDQGNEHLERENNKISNTLDQKVVVGKSDLFDGKISTNSPKTASNVNLKVDNLNACEVQNKAAIVSKGSKIVSKASDGKEEACAAQQMSDAKGNTYADQNRGVSVSKSLNVVSQDKEEELCAVKIKRKKKKKKHADQGNQHLLESGSNLIIIEQPELKSCVPDISELAVMRNETNKEVLLDDNFTAVHSRRLSEYANISLTDSSKTRKKLLILDLNGLLVDIVSVLPKGFKADKRISKKALLIRPFCHDFLKFCFAKFNVGVWSSRTKKNVDSVVNFIMADKKHELLFCWDQSHCTETGFNTVENDRKPLVFKELKKLWDKHEPNLPWEKGEYNESNTLLLDDSPYKALLNPPNTAIFPHSYDYQNLKDNSLGPGGDLRMYLESLATANNIQNYIQQNPFGQRAVTSSNPSWVYYFKVISANKFCLST